MALNTYGVSLKWGASEDAVSKVVDIKDYPDLIGEPEMLETTTRPTPRLLTFLASRAAIC